MAGSGSKSALVIGLDFGTTFRFVFKNIWNNSFKTNTFAVVLPSARATIVGVQQRLAQSSFIQHGQAREAVARKRYPAVLHMAKTRLTAKSSGAMISHYRPRAKFMPL